MNEEYNSFNITVDRLFLLAPLDQIHDDNLRNFSFNLNNLKNHQIQLKESLTYKQAIINENIYSFFLYNNIHAYLILIDKRSMNSSQTFIRYTFSGLLENYEIGQLISSTKNSFYQPNEKVDLSYIQVDVNEGYLFELDDLDSNYIDSLHWWKRGLMYQIMPSSYQDSNNDGFEDLNGLRQRLDYVQQLGVKTIWLTPIYKTPFRDIGYDISDFCSIDPRFGTMDDFKSLLNDIHSRQMRLILDFVPNHCSFEHPWFEAALQNDQHYVDYFIWHPGKTDDSSTPPTNWVGYAGQPMWTWSVQRNQWYLHQFMDSQPDLNLRNENVCQEIEKIIQFWLDLGIDGFRADATRHLFENEQYQDESLKSGKHQSSSWDYEAYEHDQTANQPENHQQIVRWRRFIDEYIRNNKRDYIILMTETQDKNMDANIPYYGLNRWLRGNDLAINFFIAYFLGEKPEDRTGDNLAKFTEDWLSKIPSEAWSTWLLSSHDSKRVATKLASRDLIDGFYMLYLLLPGTAITYYGEEIEMRHKTMDLTAFNYATVDDKKVEEKTRDGQRTPMQWNANEPNCGFTNASEPYLPLSLSWKTINVENRLNSARSHLKLYKQLVQLRQNPPFYTGKCKLVLATKDIYSFLRWSKNKSKAVPVYLIIINMIGARRNDQDDKLIKTDFIPLLKCQNKDAKGIVIARSCNIKDDSLYANEGNQVDLNNICLYSSESIVLQLSLMIDDIQLCTT